jgi:hypothetical protein
MPLLILIPFAVFFACCVAQFWFLKQVRDRLIERHPDTFLEIEKSSIFPYNGPVAVHDTRQIQGLGRRRIEQARS